MPNGRYDLEIIVRSKSQGDGLKDADKQLSAAEKSMKRFTRTVAGVATGGLLLQVGKDMIQAASDAEEMQSKFNTVFKDLAGPVTQDLQTFADTANRSIYDLQGFAATFQDTFVPLGFARDQAADMSVELVKLTEDLASFNNLPSEQVAADLQSALVGNTETLRKYGVVATQAAIDQEALNLGLEFTKGKMDAQTKAAAILSIATKSTTDAQGDAIRTADSFANQLKGLQAVQQELNVELGTVFLPIASDVVGALAEFAKGGAEGAAAIRETTAAAAELAEQQREVAAATDDYNGYGRKLVKTLRDNDDAAFKFFGGLRFVVEEMDKVAAQSGDFSGSNEDLQKSLEEVFGASVKVANGMVVVDGQQISNIATLRELNEEYINNQNAANRAAYETALYGRGLSGASTATETQVHYTNDLANSYAAAGMAAVTSSNQMLAAMEAAAAHNALVTQGFKDAEAPVQNLLQAQADLEASQGEWVQVTRSTAGQVGDINAQLAADLNKEQKDAYSEILNTVDEGSAEWLNAYNALQNDLSDSTRAGLIAQRAELEGQGDTLANIYTGDMAAAEEARAAIAAAEEAIRQEYRKTAAEAILSRDGVTQANLDLLVGIGYLSQAEADQRLEFANTQTAIEELTASQQFQQLTTEQQAVALNSLIEGQRGTAEAALNAANQMQLEGETVEELRNRLVETAGTYAADVTVDTSAANTALDRLQNRLNSITSGATRVDSAVGSQLAADAAAARTANDPSRAFGGPAFAGSTYNVHPPEYFQTKDGSYLLTPGENGRITSQAATQQALGGGGGVTIENLNVTVQANGRIFNPKQAGQQVAASVMDTVGSVG